MTAPDLLTQPQSTQTETEPASSTEESKLDLSPKGVWQRQPNETLSSYAAFTTFLELGLDATLQQVADAAGKKLTTILSLSARHHWMDRAAAWRQHVSQTFLASAQRERARQTELAQMRDQLLRQEMWEDHQTLRAFCREGLNKLRTDPANATLAGYEIKGLFDLYFKLGRAATAPTGFTFDGPAPASPEFEEAIKKTYGQKLPLDQLLDLMLLAHPDKEDMIRAKFAAAETTNSAGTNPPTSDAGTGASMDAKQESEIENQTSSEPESSIKDPDSAESSVLDQKSKIESQNSSNARPAPGLQPVPDSTIQPFNGSTAVPPSSIEIRNSKFENVNEVASLSRITDHSSSTSPHSHARPRPLRPDIQSSCAAQRPTEPAERSEVPSLLNAVKSRLRSSGSNAINRESSESGSSPGLKQEPPPTEPVADDTSAVQPTIENGKSQGCGAWNPIGNQQSHLIRNSKLENQKLPPVPFGHSLVEHARSMARLGVSMDPEDLEIAARIAKASGIPLFPNQSAIEPENSPAPGSAISVESNQNSQMLPPGSASSGIPPSEIENQKSSQPASGRCGYPKARGPIPRRVEEKRGRGAPG